MLCLYCMSLYCNVSGLVTCCTSTATHSACHPKMHSVSIDAFSSWCGCDYGIVIVEPSPVAEAEVLAG